MSFNQTGDLRYYRFETFDNKKLIQGVYTRHGGVSSGQFSTLNLGGNNGDERANVIENRRRTFASQGLAVESLFDVWQVHSATVICTDAPRPLDEPHCQADAIVTDRVGITLFMRFGDCVPILFYDPVRRVIALAHAGWQGTVKKIGAETVRAMVERYGCKPGDIQAGIGPSIGVDHYEVGSDVIEAARQAFGADADALLPKTNGKAHFDLWEANRLVLQQTGLEKIQVAGICTACNAGDWFSHRAEKGKTGRFGALIAMQE